MLDGLAELRAAVESVAALDATSGERVAERVATVGVVAALHAAAAVDGTELPERRRGAFPVFVARVANAASGVAAVRRLGAVASVAASEKATIRERIAAVAVGAVAARDARDAAVTGEIATGEPRSLAVAVGRASVTLAVHTMKPARTPAQLAAGCVSRAASERAAGASAYRPACMSTGAGRSWHACRGGNVELEAFVAGDGQHESEGRRDARPRSSPGHGTTALQRKSKRRCASAAAKPCG